jgi:hypothetical protein
VALLTYVQIVGSKPKCSSVEPCRVILPTYRVSDGWGCGNNNTLKTGVDCYTSSERESCAELAGTALTIPVQKGLTVSRVASERIFLAGPERERGQYLEECRRESL